MKINYYFLLAPVAFTFFSCSQKEAGSVGIDPIRELKFEVYDSIKVDALEILTITDYQKELDQYLMKELRGNKVMLVSGKGELIKEIDLMGEGPNQIPIALEGRFMGKDRFIFKEISASMDYHIFDRDFKKVKKIKGAAVGLNAIFISFYRQTFSAWTEEGKDFLLGEEVNSYIPAEVDPDKIGGDFYNQVKTGFFYDLNQDSITYLSLYPEAWVPRKTSRWIGQSFPYLAFDPKRKKAAVLPPIGDQLFMYDFENGSLMNETAIILTHPDRQQDIPDPSRENLLYPSFSDVKMFGEYQLALFHTAVPEDVLSEFKAKGENYHQDPAWREAVEKYRQARYIVAHGNQQVGIINELPVEGSVNFGASDGTLIVKAAEGEVERDYNLFYKIRLVE